MQANGTVIRIWRIGDIEYTETKQFAVSRAGKLSFKELVKMPYQKYATKDGRRRATFPVR